MIHKNLADVYVCFSRTWDFDDHQKHHVDLRLILHRLCFDVANAQYMVIGNPDSAGAKKHGTTRKPQAQLDVLMTRTAIVYTRGK